MTDLYDLMMNEVIPTESTDEQLQQDYENLMKTLEVYDV